MALNEDWLNKELISDQFGNFSDFGSKDLSAGTYDAGGNRYQVSDTGRGGRIVRKVGSLSDIRAQEEMDRSRQLTEQAIGTLQAQKPVIGQIYGQKRDVLQSQIDPTKARYDALISELKGQQQTAEESGQLAVNREMAKRGITQSSGLSDMTMLNTLNPIRRSYSGLLQQTGLAQEEDIKRIQDAINLLFGEQAASEMSLAGLISQAQLGGAGNALTASGQLLSNAQAQAALRQQAIEAQNQQNYLNQELAMKQALQPGQLLSQDLANQLAQYNLKNKGTGGSGLTANDIISIVQSFNRGIKPTEPKPNYTPAPWR